MKIWGKATALALTGVIALGILSDDLTKNKVNNVAQATTSTKYIKIDGYNYTQDQVDALNYLNKLRKEYGLGTVKLNPELTKAAQNHSTYLNYWGYYEGHYQEKGYKYYTGISVNGRTKYYKYKPKYDKSRGVGELISPEKDGVSSLKSFDRHTIDHKTSLLGYDVKDVGFSKKGGYGVVVIGGAMNYDEEEAYEKHLEKTFTLPRDGATNVPIVQYLGMETPEPMESFKGTPYKTGTYLYYVPTGDVDTSDVKIHLYDNKGKKVDVYYDITKDSLVTLNAPKQPLKYNTKYTAKVDFVDKKSKKRIKYQWSFTTQKDPKSKVIAHVSVSKGKTVNLYKSNGDFYKKIKPTTPLPLYKVGGNKYYLTDGKMLYKSSATTLYYGKLKVNKTVKSVLTSTGKTAKTYKTGSELKVLTPPTKKGYKISSLETIPKSDSVIYNATKK